MNERLKELAIRADFYVNDSAKLGHVWCSDQLPIDENLEEFAKLVRQDEREEIAKWLNTGVDFKALEKDPFLLQFAFSMIAGISEMITARGKK
jgi:hypothetical protein